MAKLQDVVPLSVVEIARDDRFLDNGNWVPVIEGYALPTCVEVEDAPVDPAYSDVQSDARTEPEAQLRYYQGNYMLRLHLASIQAGILDRVLGLGSFRRTKAQTNIARTIGTTILPLQPTDAEWYAVKIADNGAALPAGPLAAQIARTTFSDLSTGWFASVYIPQSTVPAAFVADTDIKDLTAEAVLSNAYLGTFDFAALTVPPAVGPDLIAAAILTYDPGRVYTVKTTVSTKRVDVIDPALQAGDFFIIVGLSYKASQLAGDGDYSIVQPDAKRSKVFLDLYRPLGDTPNADVWERRRYFHTEQTRMPSASTSGSRPDANQRVYEFICRENQSRFRSQFQAGPAVPVVTTNPWSKFYETDFLVVA